MCTAEAVLYAFALSQTQTSTAASPLLFVSPGFETLTGYSAQEAFGKDLLQLLQARGFCCKLVVFHPHCFAVRAGGSPHPAWPGAGLLTSAP